jgi:hypothetical protein
VFLCLTRHRTRTLAIRLGFRLQSPFVTESLLQLQFVCTVHSARGEYGATPVRHTSLE